MLDSYNANNMREANENVNRNTVRNLLKGERSMQKRSTQNSVIYLAAKWFVEEHNLTFVKSVYRLALRGTHILRSQPRQWLDSLQWRFESRRLRSFKDIHRDRRRCFIIGNGPSILQQDLTKLKDEITFATNWFVLHEQFSELNINYYCITHRPIWDSNGSFVEPLYTKLNANKNVVKFFDLRAKRLFKRQDLFPGHRVYFVKVDYSKAVRDGFLSLDISKCTYEGNTVIMALCLPIAYYMGFKEVYLLGCDCDWHLDKADDWSKAYFYDISKHRSKRETVEFMLDYLPEWLFKSYEVVKAAFEADGRKIYNAGVGGKLEVFERVDFESILQRSQ